MRRGNLARLLRQARRLILFLLVAIISTACSLTGVGGPPPNTPVVPAGIEGRLLYTREGSLYVLDLASRQLTQTVAPPELGEIASARWSPDGQQIAYARNEVRDRRFPVAEIWVANADGSNPRPLLPAEQQGTFYQAPVWGLDARQLYFLHSESRPGERVGRIERLTLATGQKETIVEEVGQFDVSPDGRYLALVRGTGESMGLVLVELASGSRRELVAGPSYVGLGSPRFDPGSQRVLFAASRVSGAWFDPALAGRFSWLQPPLAYAHGQPQDLWTVPVVGGSPTQILALQADEPVAAWSTDGNRLAILAAEALMVAPAAGGSATRILVPGSHGSVDWAR